MPSRPDPTIQTLIDGSQITVDPTKIENIKKAKAKDIRKPSRQDEPGRQSSSRAADDGMPGADHI